MKRIPTDAPAADTSHPLAIATVCLYRKATRFTAAVLVAAVLGVGFGTAAAACSTSDIRSCVAPAQRGDSDAIRALAHAVEDGNTAAIEALAPAAARGDSDAIRVLENAIPKLISHNAAKALQHSISALARIIRVGSDFGVADVA